jgi:predicted RNA-binding Zn ribbon-like protein
MVGTTFPPMLAVWLTLSEFEACNRLRECPECHAIFLNPTRNRSKRYCQARFASRMTSRDFRAAGKEREYRRKKRMAYQSKFTLPR